MIEIKQSKSELPVPVINDIHLHSMYDPNKEAQTFADKNQHVLENKNKILILGLGFAYHVEALQERLNEVNGCEDKEIIVLEPNIDLFKECQSNKRLPNSKNIEYICGLKVSELYNNYHFVDFLLNNPGVIAHPASFSLNKDYFTGFLEYRASTYLEDIEALCSDAPTRQYLNNANLVKWDELVHDAKQSQNINDPHDYLVMALGGFSSTDDNNTLEERDV